MEKPKKKEEKETIISGDGKKHLVYNPNAIGYNQCWDDREKWLKSKQMSVGEIEKIILKYPFQHNFKLTLSAQLATAIHKEQEKRLEGK